MSQKRATRKLRTPYQQSGLETSISAVVKLIPRRSKVSTTTCNSSSPECRSDEEVEGVPLPAIALVKIVGLVENLMIASLERGKTICIAE